MCFPELMHGTIPLKQLLSQLYAFYAESANQILFYLILLI